MTYYVIDDHPILREAVAMLLRRQLPAATVVELDRIGKVDASVAQNGKPSLFCLDLKLPDTTGVSGIVTLKRLYPDTPLAVISASPMSEWEESCVEAGADLYIEKSMGAAEISKALRELLGVEEDKEGAIAADTKLSKRQKQLLIMLEKGLSNKDIADELGISEHTVKVHLWRLYRRVGVKSRTQAIFLARSRGLISA